MKHIRKIFESYSNDFDFLKRIFDKALEISEKFDLRPPIVSPKNNVSFSGKAQATHEVRFIKELSRGDWDSGVKMTFSYDEVKKKFLIRNVSFREQVYNTPENERIIQGLVAKIENELSQVH